MATPGCNDNEIPPRQAARDAAAAVGIFMDYFLVL